MCGCAAALQGPFNKWCAIQAMVGAHSILINGNCHLCQQKASLPPWKTHNAVVQCLAHLIPTPETCDLLHLTDHCGINAGVA